ncbi:hypothetical protein AL532_10040 [Pseudomonas monteilii]|uniref:Uncharacterized protein n=1 Tax=Pseudomonas monteilii TaxID=76759 RepID=A0A6G6V5G9_9PSED|nr:hypothetical protein AL532_10040 [Pseudomonas monteilii]MVF52846.1 hypothetical protein [Pseudomonas monteilii]QIG20886.1 hypothetical protein FY041_25530 [Pseudomonas monteilii]QIG26136.1 hypothetical protein FY043_25525 [Pseudomonas monteilii]
MTSWGCFAALRGQARSHRTCTVLETCAVPVGAGLPAKGRKAAPINFCGFSRQSPWSSCSRPDPAPSRYRHRP